MNLLKVIPIVALIIVPQAGAFVGNVNANGDYLRWNLLNPDPSIGSQVFNRQTKAVRFHIGKEAYSTQNRDAEYNAVRSCFTQWQSVAGSSLKFEDAGFISSPDINTEDGTNVVYWTKTLTVNGGLDNIYGALGYAYFSFFEDNSLAEGDIVLNGAQYSWSSSVSAPAGQYAIQGVLLHEIGHILGLEHSPIGGAIMLSRGESGENSGNGLSTEEQAAVRFLYPSTASASQYAGVKGKVLLNEQGILGAVVIAENSFGNVVAGTVSRANGDYELPSMTPGSYTVRTTPLDPRIGGPPLISDFDITANGDYYNAVTAFLPTTPASITLAGGQTQSLNLPVTGGNPAFRISRIRPPTTQPDIVTKVNSPGIFQAGQSGILVGVYSPDLPVSGATLTVSGDGITHGETVFSPNEFPGQNLISVTIDVAANATPGMRNLIVKRGSDIAYANGFLVLHAAPAGRYVSIVRAAPASAGWILSWQSQSGQKYQVLGLDRLASGAWQVLSPSLTGTGGMMQWTDPDTSQGVRFFKLSTQP